MGLIVPGGFRGERDGEEGGLRSCCGGTGEDGGAEG